MLKRSFACSAIFAVVSAQDQTTLVSSVATASATATGPSTSTTEPCAVIASAQAQATRKIGFQIPADIAYECLQSVPVDKDGDSELIDELKLFLNWNTNTDRLKDELPSWYDNPSIDLYGELDKIKSSLQNDEYDSEYDVQNDITKLFGQTGDPHIAWTADIGQVFQFVKGANLVSVSSDGKEAPKVFSYDDLALLAGGRYNFSASSIDQINGMDTVEHLQKVGKQGNYHDAHARWNALFYSQAGTSLGNPILGTWTFSDYDGANTSYAFSNGTTRTISNFATVNKDFSGVEDGQSFFRKFCVPESSSNKKRDLMARQTTTPTPSGEAQPKATQARGYPPAVMLHPGYAIGGYYLNGSDDVAVLSVPTFEPAEANTSYGQQASDDFQTVAREFLKQAASEKKTKLIIDLRFNSGGNTVLGFDLFKLIFPNLEPYQASRRRAHAAFKQLVDLADHLSAGVPEFANPTDADGADVAAAFKEFAYQLATTPNDTDFASGAQFYGPHTNGGDNFTTLRGWNLTNTIGWATNFSVSGYGGELATEQPAWNASNILLLQDGACSSTCAIFSEEMRTVAGVETVFIGGLADGKAPAAQKVGGTKGWLTWNIGALLNFPRAFYTFGNQSTIEAAQGTEIERMNKTSVVADRAVGFQVNAADGIRRGDKDETSLQFIYEAAECRIYYTYPMIFDVTETWKAVGNAKWGKGSCNAGNGFGSLAKEGDGDNTQDQTPGQNAAGVTAPSLALAAAAFAIVIL